MRVHNGHDVDTDEFATDLIDLAERLQAKHSGALLHTADAGFNIVSDDKTVFSLQLQFIADEDNNDLYREIIEDLSTFSNDDD